MSDHTCSEQEGSEEDSSDDQSDIEDQSDAQDDISGNASDKEKNSSESDQNSDEGDSSEGETEGEKSDEKPTSAVGKYIPPALRKSVSESGGLSEKSKRAKIESDESIDNSDIEDEHESEQFAHDFLETKELIRFG